MFLETVKDLAYAAGRILRETLHEGFTINYKGEIDLVTEADHASEKFLINAITTHFPSHAILAEEEGKIGKAQSEYLWIIDPLDGTTNFAHRFPYFAVSIAVLEKGTPIIGVVYNPMTDEMFAAEHGCGAWLNDHRISVSQTAELKSSLLCTGFPYNMHQPQNNIAHYSRLVKLTQGVLRVGSAALDLCQVACGRFDGFWEFWLKPWDMAAGALIVQEAGGVVSGLDHPFDLYGNVIVATNGKLHNALLDQLKADN